MFAELHDFPVKCDVIFYSEGNGEGNGKKGERGKERKTEKKNFRKRREGGRKREEKKEKRHGVVQVFYLPSSILPYVYLTLQLQFFHLALCFIFECQHPKSTNLPIIFPSE